MQPQVAIPTIKGSGEVIEKKAMEHCIGCLNISKSNFPISFKRDDGFGELTTEHQYEDSEGERVDVVKVNFCPVCGRSLKELAQDSNYSHRRSK